MSLLLQQQAVRGARHVVTARAQRAVLQRQHLKRQAEQQQEQPASAPLAALFGGPSSAGPGPLSAGHAPRLLHPVNPFLLKREQLMAAAPGPPQGQQPMDVDGRQQQQQQQPAG